MEIYKVGISTVEGRITDFFLWNIKVMKQEKN